MASMPRLTARTNACAVALFFWIHFADANQLAIRNFGNTSPQGFDSTRISGRRAAAAANGSCTLIASIFPAIKAGSICGNGISTNFTLLEFPPYLSTQARSEEHTSELQSLAYL